jgi:hypothetical protein
MKKIILVIASLLVGASAMANTHHVYPHASVHHSAPVYHHPHVYHPVVKPVHIHRYPHHVYRHAPVYHRPHVHHHAYRNHSAR